jgi:hypothetical protein
LGNILGTYYISEGLQGSRFTDKMPTTHKPKYPIVDPDPSTRKAIYNFNFQDYLHITAFSTAGYGWGWLTGIQKVILRLVYNQ